MLEELFQQIRLKSGMMVVRRETRRKTNTKSVCSIDELAAGNTASLRRALIQAKLQYLT